MTKPTRKDRMRPFEYLLLAAGFALFAGLITLMSTRDVVVAIIFFGIVFILALMTLALLALAMKPDDAELHDIDLQDNPGRDRGPAENNPH